MSPDIRLPMSRWPHRETCSQSLHPHKHPGSIIWTLSKREGFGFWKLPMRALESERLPCLLNGQRHWLRGPPSPAGRFSLLQPHLRSWRTHLHPQCWPLWMQSAAPNPFTGTPSIPALPPPFPSHPAVGKSEPAPGPWPQRQAPCSCPRKVG